MRNHTEKAIQSLSKKDLNKGIQRINRRIEELLAFDPLALQNTSEASSKTKALTASIEDCLEQTFGEGSFKYKRYVGAAHFSWPLSVYGRIPFNTIQESLEHCKNNSLALLREAKKSLQEQFDEIVDVPEFEQITVDGIAQIVNTDVFIVHGHESAPREALARFIEKIGLKPIILHEQANRGSTLIEKFEKNSNVGFALVLLTPDDCGGIKAEVEKGKYAKRARQNVILELGYFIGKLGRERVCALKCEDIEIPSDILGIVWTSFDNSNAWKMALAKELQAAGYNINWNLVMNGE
ncbi:MAG: nucleotide-binding protein [Alphaproteobacteria bacterium]